MVLISTVSTFFLSFLSSSFSCLDLVLEDPARSLRLRPLPCEQQHRHDRVRKGANRRFLHTATGSNGTLRAARGGERLRGHRPGCCRRTRRWCRPRLPPFPSSCKPATNTTRAREGRSDSCYATQRPDRTACCARGGRRAGAGNVQEAAAGGAREASDAELRRLEAPADDKPHIDQHQRRAIRSRNLEISS